MRWEGGRQSDQVEDRRGARMPGGRAGGVGLVGIVIALLASWIFGINPMVTMGVVEGVSNMGGGGAAQQAQGQKGPVADEGGRFTSIVLASTEDVWHQIFRQAGAQYRPPRLVLFDGQTPTACGTGQAAAGPFYCPLDQSVYIDLSFYRMLSQKFQAPGEFANAYVVAHEVGHHIQNLLGTMKQVQGMQQRTGQRQANQLSVRLELQADCYAGVWAHHSQKARKWLDRGDVEAGLNAAAQIGDDKMMRRSQGVVVPDAFTHGSGQQRAHWFGVGMQTGRLEACDTFRQTSP
jgi:predicted metalloprotease